jgi:hypothetical protein
MAQKCLKLLEMPSLLLPINNSTGTDKPIIGPAMYQGQGCRRKSIIAKVKIFSPAKLFKSGGLGLSFLKVNRKIVYYNLFYILIFIILAHTI